MGYGLGTRFTISPPTHCNDMAVWLHRICVFFDRLFNIIDWFPTILSMAGGKVGKWFLNRINMIRLLAYSLYCQLQNSWYIYFLVQPSTCICAQLPISPTHYQVQQLPSIVTEYSYMHRQKVVPLSICIYKCICKIMTISLGLSPCGLFCLLLCLV
jgi:hypothetical protein